MEPAGRFMEEGAMAAARFYRADDVFMEPTGRSMKGQRGVLRSRFCGQSRSHSGSRFCGQRFGGPDQFPVKTMMSVPPAAQAHWFPCLRLRGAVQVAQQGGGGANSVSLARMRVSKKWDHSL